jgi:integrase
MARSIRSYQLETRTQRLKLVVRGKPYNARVAKGLRLCYRRDQTDGTWSYLHKGELRWIGLADDHQDADGVRVLSFDQAVSRCRLDVYGAEEAIENAEKPTTFEAAIDAYEADLITRDGGQKNATWLRSRTPVHLLKKVLGSITAREFRAWRDALVTEGRLESGTINRLRASVLACCNLSRKLDPRIKDAWTVGWPVLPNARKARNVVLTEAEIRAVVAASYMISPEFGLLVEMAAVTGARPSQLARLNCGDALTGDRIAMPSSRKGSRKRTITYKSAPLPASLAPRLRAIAKDQPGDAPLLVQAGGKGRWAASRHSLPFKAAVRLDSNVVTIYALRHSYATRAILRGIPLRLIADAMDTSTAMLERTYSALIANHGDTATAGQHA